MLSIQDGYQQVLDGGVRVERPPALRLVRLTGLQRVWFLQNTITADVDDVPDGRWVESCFLDPKGRVQAHFNAGFIGEEVWLDVEPDAERLATWFETYRFRTKVDITTRQSRCFTILGSVARSWAEAGELKQTSDALTFGYALGDVAAADVHGEHPPDVPEAHPDLYEVFRVEAGVGRFGVDFGERDLPQEAGLTRTVSVEKGCYVGQETVARIHFRGHVNKVLRPLTFDGGEPAALVDAEILFEGKTIGRVTSVVRSPRKGVVGLAMVRVEPPEGTRVDVHGTAAVLGALPEATKIKTG